VTTLIRAKTLRFPAHGEFEEKASNRSAYALSRVRLEMSEEAKTAKVNKAWDVAINLRKSRPNRGERSSKVLDETKGDQRHIEERAMTSMGISVTATTDVWLE
jgi:hypothetical protein